MTTPNKRRPRSRRANGQGSVYQQKDGRWVGAAYVLQADGTFKRQRLYGKSEAEVNEKLVAIQARSHQGVPAEATGWTVERFLSYWIEHVVTPSRKPKTAQGYEVVVRVHLIPALGKKRLNRLSAVDVRAFIKRFENGCLCCLHGTDTRRPEGDRKCCAVGECCRSVPSARLVQQVHAVLRNALQAAVREELLQRNVAKLVQIAAPHYEVNRGLTVEQGRMLLKAAHDDRLHALYVLALYLGLRRGELLGLQWSDVDLDAQAVTVRRTLQRVGGELRAVTPKTRTSRRTVPLIGLCVEAITAHKERQKLEAENAGTDWTDTDHVFTTTAGTPIEPDNLRRSWYPLRSAIGAEGTRFHDLRHSCVTMLLDLGVPPHIVRDIVGHADIGVTMTIYAHASLDEKREALRKLDERLK
ncbi:site-specific integrase [Dactylosporangium sp. CA-233914]|uniref:site-specific integrase n=1 Tax=Dactylosporangium sp. CA-233914 TaxID=3239934 RepID=UPI003D8F53BD